MAMGGKDGKDGGNGMPNRGFAMLLRASMLVGLGVMIGTKAAGRTACSGDVAPSAASRGARVGPSSAGGAGKGRQGTAGGGGGGRYPASGAPLGATPTVTGLLARLPAIGVPATGAPVPFYLYDTAVFDPPLCDEGYAVDELPKKGYWCTGTEWLVQARVHPWRVTDPAEAKLFVVGFDACRSFAHRYQCEGKTHVDRVNAIFKALAASPWYRRKGGHDHFWHLPHNTLPVALLGKHQWRQNSKTAFFPNPPQADLIRNMSVGRYLSYHMTLSTPNHYGFEPAQRSWVKEGEKWGCTVVLPIVTPRSLWMPDTVPFEQWERRSTLLFFRGNNGYGGGCYMRNGQHARAKAVELGGMDAGLPKSILTNAHAASPEAYRAEILDAKYCLVFACDDPQTSRFFDAVAAGCIPVLINDAWRIAVGPFSGQLNYDAFTITVPEFAWMDEPAAAAHLIYDHPRDVQRQRFDGLKRHRPEIMFRHPQSNVGTRVLKEAAGCLGGF